MYSSLLPRIHLSSLPSAKNIWLIDVDGTEPVYGYSHYGIDVNTSMSVFQGTKEIPENVQQQVDAFYNAMDSEKYEEAKTY